ncbi:SUMF1/EgtB/PvdO family nonheme iron enzyme, partial [Crocinitomicaceae bacterium]|nr:SUMF1/EgtB/PvdO family nonheme iron enzyme [Crocinitomicaceae bacterium]
DQTEVTNFHWLEYLYWIGRAYGESYPMVQKNALPDTLVWRSKLGDNEKYVDYYLRHPAYRDYPVVGVSWLQANDFCKWRTDRVNEYILIREGIFKFNNDQRNENAYNTDAYYAGQYDEESLVRNIENLNPDAVDAKGKLGRRQVRMEDGILLPRYRLPTEAEWEFAASGLIGNLQAGTENIDERRIYPWDGHWVRQDEAQFTGQIRANFVRGRGDYMGVAGNLNDGADVTAPVESYWPNDYGLYHMAGNVSEWVKDVYRPLTSEDYDEFRPFRGNVFKTKLLNNEGKIEQRNQQVQYDIHGMKEYLNEFERIRFQRISANNHDPNDTVIPIGLSSNIGSRNQVKQGYAPDPFYVSHGKIKDSIELQLLADINSVIDQALIWQNEKHYIEASALIQDRIFDEIFTDSFREGPDGEEYAFDAITILRDGFREFIIDTPGKLKYRNVTEEENIGRLNYRRDDYIDYLDGDIESSIFYANDERKNDINQATRDPKLIMYQSMHEEYDLDGGQVKPGDRTSWPTTLISDKSRVYKGGSWKDRAYWLAPSQRRHLDEDKSTDAIGFRCAMDRVGSPTGFNYGRKKQKKK